jgi:hypothetical protein
MSSPCIDLDMNLLSSPDPPESAASGRGAGDADANDVGAMEDLQFDHSMMQSLSPDQYHITYNSRNEDSSGNNIEDGSTNDSATTERVGHSNCDEQLGDNPTTTAQQQQERYAVMSQLVESWREELHMMNVNNSILLDDLVTLGADNI